MADRRPLRFLATGSSGDVSALLDLPEDARALLVMAHGAGAGMEHPFMAGMAERLAERGVAVFRFNFPYVEQGKRRPDPPPIATRTIENAVRAAAEAAPDLPIFAGGKSFGGRMSSTAAAKGTLGAGTGSDAVAGADAAAGAGTSTGEEVRGLVFFGFPLHSPAKPGNERAAHLADVAQPMLFLQGSRDALARLELLRPVLAEVSERATLHVIDDANHGFHVPKRSGRTDADVLDELADVAAEWMRRRV